MDTGTPDDDPGLPPSRDDAAPLPGASTAGTPERAGAGSGADGAAAVAADAATAAHDVSARGDVAGRTVVAGSAAPRDAADADATTAALADALAAVQRRANVLVGALAVVLCGALVLIAVLFGRVGGGQDAATRAELDELRAEIERVEAGAALYAAQLEGYQELFAEAAPQIAEGVDEAIAGLRDFGSSKLEFDLPLRQTVTVPIRTEIPIQQSFDTRITVSTPLGFDVPLNVTVPVDVVVPVDLEVDIPVDETVPISIDVSQTEFATLTDSLATGLESLKAVLSGLSAPPGPTG